MHLSDPSAAVLGLSMSWTGQGKWPLRVYPAQSPVVLGVEPEVWGLLGRMRSKGGLLPGCQISQQSGLSEEAGHWSGQIPRKETEIVH